MQKAFSLLLLLAAVSCRTTDSAQLNQAADAVKQGSGERATLNSTIMLMGNWDWGKDNGRCKAVIDEALSERNHNDTLNFVPTQYGIFEPSGHGKIRFCAAKGSSCAGLDAKGIKEFQEGVTACLAYAVKKGREIYGKPLNISILPHIDDGTEAGAWRNSMKFDPFPTGPDCSQNPQFSYFCTMVKPMAEAVAQVAEPGAKVYFSLQGEMGATVFGFPRSYTQLLPVTRKLLTDPKRLADQDVLLGLSLNYTRATGDVFDGDKNDLAALFANPALGFLGVSSYGELSYSPSPDEFDRTLDTFAGELAFMGVSLEQIQQRGAQIHFSEYGFGGGNINGQAVSSGWLTSSSPWAGVYSRFSLARSPWVNQDVTATQEAFYCAGLRYLGGAGTGRWRVQHAFIWNLTSWDVQAIYPDSSSPEGSYRSPTITGWIKTYNKTGSVSCPVQQKALPRLGDGVIADDFEGYSGDMERLRRIYTLYPKAMGMQAIDLVTGDKGQALKLTYKIGTGMWDKRAGIWLHGPFKWKSLQKQGLRLTLRAPAGTNFAGKKLTFGLRESSGEYWEQALPWTSAQGGVFSFSFDKMVSPLLEDNFSADRRLDLDDVFSFYLLLSDDKTEGKTEAVQLDQLEMY